MREEYKGKNKKIVYVRLSSSTPITIRLLLTQFKYNAVVLLNATPSLHVTLGWKGGPE